MSVQPGATYAAAGVDIAAGDAAVEAIKDVVASTTRPEVLGGIGGFGGMFALDIQRHPNPVLVSSTDGVGTKLEVARLADRFDTVGIDLVALCVEQLRQLKPQSTRCSGDQCSSHVCSPLPDPAGVGTPAVLCRS